MTTVTFDLFNPSLLHYDIMIVYTIIWSQHACFKILYLLKNLIGFIHTVEDIGVPDVQCGWVMLCCCSRSDVLSR